MSEPTWEQIEAYLDSAGWNRGEHNAEVSLWTMEGRALRIERERGIKRAVVQIAHEDGSIHPGDLRAYITAGEFPPRKEVKTAALAEIEEYAYERYVEWMTSAHTALGSKAGLPDVDTPLRLGLELRGVIRLLCQLKTPDRGTGMYWMREAMRMDIVYRRLSERFRQEHPAD